MMCMHTAGQRAIEIAMMHGTSPGINVTSHPSIEKNKKQNSTTFNLLSVYTNSNALVSQLLFGMNYIKTNEAFWVLLCFPIPDCAEKKKQYSGLEYDHLQNWLDMTSPENPLLCNTRAFQLKSTAGRTHVSRVIRRAAWSKIRGVL